MSVPIKFTVIKGTPVAREFTTVDATEGTFVPLAEDFFRGAVAVTLALPENVVAIDLELIAAYRATLEERGTDPDRILIHVGEGDCGTEVARAEAADAIARSVLALLAQKAGA